MASAAKCILGLGMAGAIAGTMLYASMPEKKRRHLKNNVCAIADDTTTRRHDML